MSILTKINDMTDAQKARIVKLLKQADSVIGTPESDIFRDKAYVLAEVTPEQVTLTWETVGRGKAAKDVLTVTLSEAAEKAQREQNADAITRAAREAVEKFGSAALTFSEAKNALLKAVEEAQQAGDFYKDLGFKSWTEWVKDVFKDVPAIMGLPKAEKMELFETLWLQGMSQPVIAAMLGISSGAASRWAQKVDPTKSEDEDDDVSAPKVTEDNPYAGMTVDEIFNEIALLRSNLSFPGTDRETIAGLLRMASEAILTAPMESVASAA